MTTVIKFGGSSVKNSEIIQKVSEIINNYISDDSKFSHTISYHIKLINSNVELEYNLSGDFGSMMLEMSLKPILHGIIIDELRNIKLAVESSDEIIKHHNRVKKLKPI